MALRLASRIAAYGIKSSDIERSEALCDIVKNSRVVICDSIFKNSGTGENSLIVKSLDSMVRSDFQDSFKIVSDTEIFCEMTGCFGTTSRSVTIGVSVFSTETSIFMACVSFFGSDGPAVTECPVILITDGNEVRIEYLHDIDPPHRQALMSTACFAFAVSAYAVRIMNCKNISTIDVTDKVGPDRKWLRRTKTPEIRYHVLSINPLANPSRSASQPLDPISDPQTPLHICRGHFKTYTEERPLFGKYTGRFWIPTHARGNPEHGIVDKDYRIVLPDDSTPLPQPGEGK